ncbi:hypothetical protein CERSUDRAFT_91116 [Gelatoporia subvermispora B]|uniref:Cell division control protein 14 n=1 Tax=Ceriporiopsis subvermispora (strain B) TaxID=914234 RepID=M2RNG7_CERS8|nr:hypothetical protein CERSUDRAFT_91116 [Gelatoporia subvermispora B]
MLDMRIYLQDLLDELVSSRTSAPRVGEILTSLERSLAEICIESGPGAAEQLSGFLDLQDAFECNVPSRLLTWISLAIPRLELLVNKGAMDKEQEIEATLLSSHLAQALSLIQGVVLMHATSKEYLGRRYALQILLDLMLASRHLSTTPSSPPSATSTPPSPSRRLSRTRSQSSFPLPLASAILDTLLCVLVDSSPALRVFEETKGVQTVVRILKRAGTPREVRMKCLEFLYFYLLDETSLSGASSIDSFEAALGGGSPLASSTPRSFRPSHRTTESISRSVDSSCSDSSYTSRSSDSSATSISSLEPTPSKPQFDKRPPSPTSLPNEAVPVLLPSPRIITPPNSRAQPRSLLMLRKEVDFVPLSPKKAQISRLGSGIPRTPLSRQSTRMRSPTAAVDADADDALRDVLKTPIPKSRPGHVRGLSASPLSDSSDMFSSPEQEKTPRHGHRRAQSSVEPGTGARRGWESGAPSPISSMWREAGVGGSTEARTMEEKKEILGSMLGNVDALVEGVRKAGIWGLS